MGIQRGLISRTRRFVTVAFRFFLSKIGVRPTKIEEYRDNFLIILVTIGLFIALLPFFEALEGRTPSDSQITSCLIWLAVALSISTLSSNWNHILAIACGFIGLRGILGAIKTGGGLRAIAIALLFGALF